MPDLANRYRRNGTTLVASEFNQSLWSSLDTDIHPFRRNDDLGVAEFREQAGEPYSLSGAV